MVINMKRPKLPLPAEKNEFIITIDGLERLLMEGCERILRYDESEMVLEGKSRVEIRGNGLDLKEVGNDNIMVTGKIKSVEFGSDERSDKDSR